MKRCHLCDWLDGHHDKACPEIATDKPRALADQRRGWDDGRAGRVMRPSESATYRLGWIRGTSALEEAQNGHDPRFDD